MSPFAFKSPFAFILCSVFCVLSSFAHETDTVMPLYGGTQVKLDIASPIITPATTGWQRQHYEMAVNVRLANRFYPTLELGYATSGGFLRLGCDINPLKKHPDSPHALLVGVRAATAVQDKGYTDCWGEVVAGCQVEVAQVGNTAFYMGWMGRFKCLFTRNGATDEPLPNNLSPLANNLSPLASYTFIPGFGSRQYTGWGVNYYLGWRF